jgi:hypothetical protein
MAARLQRESPAPIASQQDAARVRPIGVRGSSELKSHGPSRSKIWYTRKRPRSHRFRLSEITASGHIYLTREWEERRWSYMIGQLTAIAVAPYTQKSLFGSRYITLGRLLFAEQLIFEACMALGYHYREKLDLFLIAGQIVTPGKESTFSSYLQNHAHEIHASLQSRPPTELSQLFLEPKLRRLGLEIFSRELATRKISQKDALYHSIDASMGGIAFGSTYPDLAEKLWTNTYCRIDTKAWTEAWQSGLDIPRQPPTPVTLQERIAQLMPFVRDYIREHNLDLLNVLAPESDAH